MDECEFKKFCDSIGYTYVCQKDRKEIAYCPVRITLNSPQFKKEYTTIKECKDFALSEYSRGIDDGWNKANQEFVVEGKATRPEVIELVGETKEHAEQYANREELVEAIRERQILGEITFPEIENIIRTHALKEE